VNVECVRVEGALIPADILATIAAGQAKGQKPEDFGLARTVRLTDEIAAAWSDARAFWRAFQHSLRPLRDADPATTQTREQWVQPLLRVLGYERLAYMRAAAQVEGQSYAISHRASGTEDSPPIHIEGCRTDLDRRPPSGRPRLSPHSLLQEYLNRTEHLWAIVTNGHHLRLLRNSVRTSRPTYVEFDLQQIMEGDRFAEFALLYRLIHRTRLPQAVDDGPKCLLETYHQQAIEAGGRVREGLRFGVEEALKILGNGFLTHPTNETVREVLAGGRLKPIDYYAQLLRLIYRLLFLMVSEERKLVGPTDRAAQERYRRHYSVSRLRTLAEHRVSGGERHGDLWLGLLTTFRLYSDDHLAERAALAPLDGDLFGPHAIPDLEKTHLSNADLLRAIRHLSLYREDKVLRRVNYAALDVEELGSVYESLLDYRPDIRTEGGHVTFDLVPGAERKTTGSYYTPPELVQELIKSALEPVIEAKLKDARTPREKEDALLSLTVCDPACGSGHFLLAAARRIGREIARIRTGEDEPTPDEFRLAVRDVIRHSIYAVDRNPLAVELCKLALWLEGHSRGKPLTFLDHRIKCGDSLIGVMDPGFVDDGIPDDAFTAVTGDDKKVAAAIRQRNRSERKGQRALPYVESARTALAAAAEDVRGYTEIPEDTPADVRRKAERYREFREREAMWRARTAANLWTAAFFVPLTDSGDVTIPTHGRFRDYLERGGIDRRLTGGADLLAIRQPFFHWYQEFPEVFRDGGFDAVLGNPPWERIKLQEEEFFAARDPEIANAPNKAARQRLIDALPRTNPALAKEFSEAKHEADAQSKFCRHSGRFPLTGVGDINTYALFAELARQLLKPTGRVGITVPSGIATDDTTKFFFQDLMSGHSLVSLYEFENEGFFAGAGQGHMIRFCLLTLGGRADMVSAADFMFQGKSLQDLAAPERRFRLTEDDIGLLNPNTRTCPIFRTRRDADLTKAIYQRAPVLVNEARGDAGNPWGASFLRMLDMANDSGLFRTARQLEGDGWTLRGNIFNKGSDRCVPLYEAKMIHQFNHRRGDYGLLSPGESSHVLPDVPDDRLSDPGYSVLPRYWVLDAQVEDRLQGKWDRGWLLGWRDVTDARASARTVVASVIPRVGVGHKFLLMFPVPPAAAGLLVACLNSFALDYCARQKVGGLSLNYFTMKQLPILPPNVYASPAPWSKGQTVPAWIRPRILELVYTACDLEPFARDLGWTGPPFRWDPDRRLKLRCELDAAFFHLYGVARDDVDYIMETFPIVRRNDEHHYGAYRTKLLVLDIYDRMQHAISSGHPYQTILDPPPGDHRVTH
jgi:hypothetical protein